MEFSTAQKNLRCLIEEFSPLGELSNEAQTRYSFIDRFLKDCLDWSDAGSVQVEVHEKGDRTDYECGQPRQMIIEAKKASSPFKFPPKGIRNTNRYKLASLVEFNKELQDAIQQAMSYGQTRGVQISAVANGPQLIVFLAARLDGTAPLDGDAIVYRGYEELDKYFPQIFEYLTPSGIEERRLAAHLESQSPSGLPPKLSTLCSDYFDHKYSSAFQESLRNSASLVVEDLGRTTALERDFLLHCYCESGPLSQYAMVGKQLLAARYTALFDIEEPGSQIESVNPKKGGNHEFGTKAVSEATAKRPIILIGDVGVGKTSFLKHLVEFRAESEFKTAINIYFDLGHKGNLTKTTREALLQEVENTLQEKYQINLQDEQMIEEIYFTQIRNFESGFLSKLKEIDPTAWMRERLTLLIGLVNKREEHLRLVLAHIGVKKKKQVIVIIDNADQRSLQVQHEAFLIAQELAQSWKCMVFLALRPQTFHASKRSGAISAYPPKVFVIQPPKLEEAIEKRLNFALEIARGKISSNSIPGLTLHLDSLAVLISVVKRTLLSKKDIMEFIVNVSGGNVRAAIELISKFLGSPNIESEKIVKIYKESGSYDIPFHEFTKVALLGDNAHFQEEASFATNLFSVIYPDKKEHFLSPLILGFLNWDGAQKDGIDGFIRSTAIAKELQEYGFTAQQTTSHLLRLTRRKLIEAEERKLTEIIEGAQQDNPPKLFRITTLGAYHIKRWIGEFSYLDAVAFDTPIFDPLIRDDLATGINDPRLSARFHRAEVFANYLDSAWKLIPDCNYLDWKMIRATGNSSFAKVSQFLRENNLGK